MSGYIKRGSEGKAIKGYQRPASTGSNAPKPGACGEPLKTEIGHANQKGAGESDMGKVLLNIISHIPNSNEKQSSDPLTRSRSIARAAALRSAAISGSLALPPGPIGMATILPDLVAIWHLQQQTVSDIASCYGKKASLTREVMIFCLFRHCAALFVRDLVVRVGERVLVRRVALRSIQQILQKLGVRVTQRLIGNTISRYVPVIGAIGMGSYSYFDTRKVAETAIDLFSKTVEVETEEDTEADPIFRPKDR